VTKKNDNYHAECLELGLAAVGDTEHVTRQRLEDAIQLWIETAKTITEDSPAEKITVNPVPFYFIRRLLFDCQFYLSNQGKGAGEVSTKKRTWFILDRPVPANI
jgi:predicted RNase H-like HicB family nuclease